MTWLFHAVRAVLYLVGAVGFAVFGVWHRLSERRHPVIAAADVHRLLVIRLEHPSEEPGHAPADAPVKPG